MSILLASLSAGWVLISGGWLILRDQRRREREQRRVERQRRIRELEQELDMEQPPAIGEQVVPADNTQRTVICVRGGERYETTVDGNGCVVAWHRVGDPRESEPDYDPARLMLAELAELSVRPNRYDGRWLSPPAGWRKETNHPKQVVPYRPVSGKRPTYNTEVHDGHVYHVYADGHRVYVRAARES